MGSCIRTLAWLVACLSSAMSAASPQAVRHPSDVTISNGVLEATMAASACGETRAGSVISLVICSSGEDLLCGGDFGSFRCGSLVPYDGSIDVVSDSEAVFTAPGLRSGSGSAILPVQVTGRFRLAGGGVSRWTSA